MLNEAVFYILLRIRRKVPIAKRADTVRQPTASGRLFPNISITFISGFEEKASVIATAEMLFTKCKTIDGTMLLQHESNVFAR